MRARGPRRRPPSRARGPRSAGRVRKNSAPGRRWNRPAETSPAFGSLVEERVIAKQEFEAQRVDVQVARETANAAEFAVRAATSELQRAEARLAPTRPEAPGRVVSVTAPVDGVVLKRVRESETFVPTGDPLIEIGDPGQLEIVADLLSTDAVRVKVGARAFVEQWGGDTPLEARVRRIEPAGFMKISALGVEEQRVNVVLDFVDASPAARAALGDGYRVEVRIVIWESSSVMKVPTSALFRHGEKWAVYVDGRRPCASDRHRVGTPDGSVRGSDRRARRRHARDSPPWRYARRRRPRARTPSSELAARLWLVTLAGGARLVPFIGRGQR